MIEKKYLLTEIRQGDYTHAGDEEAIEMMLPFISSKDSLLDIGSGLGGTAEYIRQRKGCNIVGIDKDIKAIRYAKNNYKKITFEQVDANNLSEYKPNKTFNVAIFFNSLYAISDHKKVIRNLDRLICPNGKIIVFDYATNADSKYKNPFNSTEDKIFNPINLSSLPFPIEYSINIIDTTDKYINWYKDTLDHLLLKKSSLIKKYGNEPFSSVFTGFTNLIALLRDSNLLGALVVATKKR